MEKEVRTCGSLRDELRLRPYKPCDAETIAGWIGDEETFLRWGGDRFGPFPVTAAMIDEKYRLHNGDCAEPDNFYPWVAVDDRRGVVGHFIMRFLHGDRRLLRFGWVVVDGSVRGAGYGTRMLRLGLRCAFDVLGADRVTIGVYENNAPAHRCYRKAGFADRETVEGKPWNIIEMEIGRDAFA